MAAAYVFHLAQNHAFVDGNKRIAGAAGSVFLQMNGVDWNGPEDEYTELILAVAEGKADKKAVAAFFRRHIGA
jgi:death-on-curing protein